MKDTMEAFLVALTAGIFIIFIEKALEKEPAESNGINKNKFECSYRVTGVSYDDVLNIRARPSSKSRIVGEIPPNAYGIQVYRTKGRWGRVRYGGIQGWSHLGYLKSACD